jgi:hypothetical protein
VLARSTLSALLAWMFTACAPPPATDNVESLASPARPGSAEPHLARSDDGTLVLSWLEPDGAGVVLRHTTLDGDSWREPRTVTRGEDWFVNWADFPSVVPIHGARWAAHWLVRQPAGGYAYDVAIAVSEDAGLTWTAPVTPHDDGTPTEHGFVSLFPAHEGVAAIWLDGRQLAGDHAAHGIGAAGVGTELRSATIASGGTVSDSSAVDTLVCDCCQTDVAMGAQGPVAVYRDRSDAEIRDIYVARSVDGEWQPGRAVAEDGWRIDGCPVNGPAIAADGERVAVAWYTAAGDSPRVRLGLSTDGAASFDQTFDVDATNVIGRVDVELVDDSGAVVSWLRAANDKAADLVLRRVSATGAMGPIATIARTGAARPSGFPQMVRSGAALVLAWTDTSVQPSEVRTVRVAITALDD